MDDDLVFIPSNYTDAGKVFGVFEIRNTIEGLIFCVPLSLLLVNLCSGFSLSLTATTLIVSATGIPTGGLCLSGIYGYSLLTFLRIYFLWRRRKGILTYRQLPKQKGKGVHIPCKSKEKKSA